MPVPPPVLGDLDGLITQVRAAGLPVTLRVRGATPGLPTGVQLAVFRIVQEALTNTLKHAGPGVSARVDLRYGGNGVDVDVTDTGRDEGGSIPPAAPGHGIVGMRERAAVYAG